MGKLDGKVAIITGAAQGMGAAHAKLFVSEGTQVVITDIKQAEGEQLAAELGADKALFIKHDVAVPLIGNTWLKQLKRSLARSIF